jgi:hypothetical protein
VAPLTLGLATRGFRAAALTGVGSSPEEWGAISEVRFFGINIPLCFQGISQINFFLF